MREIIKIYCHEMFMFEANKFGYNWQASSYDFNFRLRNFTKL